MYDYELVIVQERRDVDEEFLVHLVGLELPVTVVQPHAHDFTNGCTKPGYCAVARNEVAIAGTTPWIVYLAQDATPDGEWLQSLESDLANADDAAASICVGFESASDEIGRASDIAYRRETVLVLGGFEMKPEANQQEDLLLQIAAMKAGLTIVRGARGRLARRT